MPRVLSLLVSCIGTVLWSYLLMGDELGCATGIDRLPSVVSFRTLVYTDFHLDREGLDWEGRIFGAVIEILGQKCRE